MYNKAKDEHGVVKMTWLKSKHVSNNKGEQKFDVVQSMRVKIDKGMNG